MELALGGAGCSGLSVWKGAASRSSPLRETSMGVLPSERLLSNAPGGTPVPDTTAELPPVIHRTEVVALALVGLLILSIVAVLYIAKAFFLPVVMSFVVGTMLSPAANFLERHRIPRALAAVLIVMAVGATVTIIVGLISSPLMEWSTHLPELGAQLKEKLHVFDRPLALWQDLQGMLGNSNPLGNLPLPSFDWVQPTLQFLSPTFTEFLLFFATLVLFIASWRDLRRTLIMIFGDHDARLRTLRILNEIELHLGNYLLTVTVINLGVGIATGIVCAIAGMPRPAGLGALAATLNFIPIIGPIATFVILAVVGIVALPSLGAALIAPLAFCGLAFLEGHFITPTIIGRRLELNALAVFLGIAFWTWMWGPMGAFLSSPLLIVAVIMKEHLWPVNSPQLPTE
jgi:predicted PurR-regulated permease PerM